MIRSWVVGLRRLSTGRRGSYAESEKLRMANVSGEILINRPVEQVFDFVADQRNEPSYNPRMLQSEKITEGAIGVGDSIPRDRNVRAATGRIIE